MAVNGSVHSKVHREYLATDKIVRDLEAETVEFISDKELDMEEMMERMQRSRELGSRVWMCSHEKK